MPHEAACAGRFHASRYRRYHVAPLAAVLVAAILQTATAEALVIGGATMSMDQAIMAASQSSKVFRLMEDANVVRVELDMLFHTDVWESMMRERENSTRRHRRKVIRDQRFRWPNAEIPYQMTVAFSSGEMQQFNDALADYHRYTCIRFRKAVPNDKDYVRIIDGGGCFSFVGRGGGEQRLSLASGCRHKGIIIHELGHAVGFNHEQTRPDRDNHVYIVAENIESFMLYNFQKYTPAEMDTANVPYDYLSVMHYGEYAFSRNGQRSIRTRDPAYQNRIGNRGGLSFRDIKAANAMYSCASRSGCPARRCPGEGFVGRDCTCWCPSGNDASPVTQCAEAATRPGVQPTTTVLQTRPRQATPAGTTTTSRTAAALTTARSRPCHDANAMCRSWAERGECEANPRYMLTHCAASCRMCSGGGSVMATTLPACSNLEVHCDYWQGRGYCRTPLYAAYMQLNCRLACGACSAVTATQRATTVTVTAATYRRTPVPVATTRPPVSTTTTSSASPQSGSGVVIKRIITSAFGKVTSFLNIGLNNNNHQHGTRDGGQQSERHGGRPTLKATTRIAIAPDARGGHRRHEEQRVDSSIFQRHRHHDRHDRHQRLRR